MSKNTIRILEKIKELEAEKARLLPLRKEEIFNVLHSAGGLALDNKLLAGLAVYTSNPENADSNFLKELSTLGKSKIPSRKSRSSLKTVGTNSPIQPNTTKKEKAHG